MFSCKNVLLVVSLVRVLVSAGVKKPPAMLLVLSCLLCARTALGMPESVRAQIAEIKHMSEALHAKMAVTDEQVGTLLRDGVHRLEWAAKFVEQREEMLLRESIAAEESAQRVQDLKYEVSARHEAGIPTPDPCACHVGVC